jgi:uncharacterized protein
MRLPVRYPLFALVALLCLLPPALLLASEVPFLEGRVNDTANLLSAATVSELESLLKTHQDSTSNQVVVLTIQSLEGDDIESYAIRVAETWKLGQKGKDNGVLLVVARDDRKVRIEVGRGLEGDLTDAICSVIIRREILPQFKSGDYDRGVQAGVTAILAAIRGAYTPDEESGQAGDIIGGLIGFAIFLAVVGVFTAIALFSKGFVSWFLYVFLIPFWAIFPMALLGALIGGMLFASYLLGFPLAKFFFGKTEKGKSLMKQWGKSIGTGSGRSGGWSSGGSRSSGGGSHSSGGGGFSGGGGSFSGGGSSGSW